MSEDKTTAVEETVTVTTFELDVLVNVAPEIVVLIG